MGTICWHIADVILLPFGRHTGLIAVADAVCPATLMLRCETGVVRHGISGDAGFRRDIILQLPACLRDAIGSRPGLFDLSEFAKIVRPTQAVAPEQRESGIGGFVAGCIAGYIIATLQR